jgi:signal transduction histidine kinase
MTERGRGGEASNFDGSGFGQSVFRIVFQSVSHAFAAIQFSSVQFNFDEQYRWPAQFWFLLALSLCLSCLLEAGKGKARVLILLLRILALALLSVPLRSFSSIVIILSITLLLDINLLLPIPWIIALSALTVVLFLSLQKINVVFRQNLPDASTVDSLTAFFCSACITVLINLYRMYRQRAAAQMVHARRMDSTINQLMKRNMDFQEQMSKVVTETATRERKRIAGDLHDVVTYTLTNMLIILEAVLAIYPKDHTETEIKKLKLARRITRYGLHEFRRILRNLTSAEERDVLGFNRIYHLAKSFEQATGTRVKIEYGNVDDKLVEGTWNVIYHMVQEGMLNAFRHGQATLIRIIFWQDGARLHVIISDNGYGCRILQKGIGLSGMEERIQSLGGSLRINNAIDGFELIAWLPYE